MRYGPSLKFGWATEVPFGSEVRILRQTLDSVNNDGLGGWYEIELPDGRDGSARLLISWRYASKREADDVIPVPPSHQNLIEWHPGW